MLVIGFEGSANKLGIGIIKDNEVLTNERVTYISPEGSGFIPGETASHHKNQILPLLKKSLEKAKIKLSEIDLFCYTKGPGMAAPLIVVATVARTLAYKYKKPLMPVNHCVAHIEMGRFVTKANNPTLLYVSGGNTQIISYKDNRYKVFGETLDIAVGNCLDRIGRELKLSNKPSPAANIELEAKKGKNFVKLPYVVKGMDVSFSGLLSYTKRLLQKEKVNIYDLCFSLQETVFAALVEVLERAMAFCDSNEALIVGGVGCNLRLQQMVEKMVSQRNGKVYYTDERFCIDNGLMIAYTGKLMYESNYKVKENDLFCQQAFRTESVEITWRN
ncbi:O-sialoglyco endopeptidase [Tubulinosema ratisbonensis]|uniref:N(6)-L-threonylcarbamoyladenine synthase n=1 Tax=Tubulinosema ratisbonensis TaxID=291195 RepID=A0A437AKM4_9MICR|nr:O-sialoglyco endopeptidase [Tubulinosema ratisbonensis]